jgi:hypothetical protein
MPANRVWFFFFSVADLERIIWPDSGSVTFHGEMGLDPDATDYRGFFYWTFWNSFQIRPLTVRKYGASTSTSDVRVRADNTGFVNLSNWKVESGSTKNGWIRNPGFSHLSISQSNSMSFSLFLKELTATSTLPRISSGTKQVDYFFIFLSSSTLRKTSLFSHNVTVFAIWRISVKFTHFFWYSCFFKRTLFCPCRPPGDPCPGKWTADLFKVMQTFLRVNVIRTPFKVL